MNTISPINLKKAAKDLPPSPQIFGKLGKMFKNPDTGLDDITGLVNSDSSLTAQVLRLSNSATYSQGSAVDTLDEAINRIGFRELFKLVGMAAASQVFSERNQTYGLDGSLLWENSLASGLAMERLAHAAGGDEQEAYTMGLLRSIGKMVIDACAKADGGYPNYPAGSEAPLIDWEETNFGITNPSVAGFLVASWNFPGIATGALQHQYAPEKAPKPTPYIYLLNLANGIAERIGKPLKGEAAYWEVTDDKLERVGLERADLDRTAEEVAEELENVVSSVAS